MKMEYVEYLLGMMNDVCMCECECECECGSISFWAKKSYHFSFRRLERKMERQLFTYTS